MCTIIFLFSLLLLVALNNLTGPSTGPLVCHRARVRAQTCSVVNKISFKALVYTLFEDESPGCAIPSLIFHYQCVCSRVCI